jgi:K+-transporting ATPase c subunit
MAAGIYKFELKVTDNNGATAKDTIQVIVNIPPVANAGNDQSITIPVNSVNFSGSGTDADGTIAAYHWTKVSGPIAGGTFTNANAAATSMTALVAGVYKIELKVTDNYGATDTDTLQLIVVAPNVAPIANAGLDQSITLPTNTATLSGSGIDPDGLIVAYHWTKISGPAAGTITNASLASTTVTGLAVGIYQFELKVTDNDGATATDVMQVTVNPANRPPLANAGVDKLVYLPSSQVSLIGSGNDVDGTVVGYTWRQISGPPDKLTSVNTPVTVLQNLVAATYKFELTVTDDKGATGKDTVEVIAENLVVPAGNKLKVYPNPVVDITTVEIDATTANSTLLMVVTDAQGKIVYQKKLPGTNYITKEKVNMSTFGKGAYFITVYFNSKDKLTTTAAKL